ncbi:MAG: ABC transporter transmembrane domain-containing protein, partial [Halobacteria archaeon]|nr:ABC transporter transmembrane domain-containing protein [Halobacteria archaeon]
PMLRLFTEYGGRNARYFGVGIVASVFARVLDLLPPLVLGVAIDTLFRGETPDYVPAGLVPTGREEGFWFFALVIVASFLLSAVFHWARNWGWNSFAQNVQHTIRTDTYDSMQRLNMTFFDD